MPFKSDAQRRAAFASMNSGRSYHALNKDMAVRAKETLPNTPENVKLWRENPRRIDIEGIDTPMSKTLPVKQKNANEIFDDKYNPSSDTPKEWDVHNPNLPKHKQTEHAMIKAGEGKQLTKIEQGLIDEHRKYVESEYDRKESDRKKRLGYLTVDEVDDISFSKLNETRLDPDTDYLSKETDDQIKHIIDVKNKPSMHDVTYNDKYIMLAEHSAKKRGLKSKSEERYEKHPDKTMGAPSAPTEFKADTSLLNKDLLRHAHRNTSFDPEKRAESEKLNFKREVEEVYEILKENAKTPEQKAELEQEMVRFQKNYADKYNDTLASRGRIASSMITGPANFPVRRNEKAQRSYENKLNANTEFRDKVISGIQRRWNKENVESAGGERAVLEKKLAAQEKSHQQMKDINVIMRKKGTDDDKRAQLEKIGVSDNLITDVFKPDYAGRKGFPGFYLTNSNAKIKSMEDRLSMMDKFKAKETTSAIINGVKVVDNNEDDRIQIFFDGKPDDTMRAKLKGSGWRWAPSVGAWQRKRTNNAIYSAKQILRGD